MLALAAGTVITGTAAQASVLPLPNLVQVLVPSVGANPTVQAGAATDQTAANAADPLSNYCTYDIQVVVTTPSASQQDRWASADLRAQLGAGMFYIPPNNPGDPTTPVDNNYLQAPGLRNLPGQRYLQVDTMVMSPIASASRGGVLGKSTFAPATQPGEIFPSNGANFLDPADTNNTTFLPANSMMLVDVAWGDSTAGTQPAGSNGTFTIARLTVKVGTNGTFIGRVGSTLNPSNPVSFTYVLGGVAVTPEPTSVALLGLGLGAVALRRRK
jgi:hypothetical protein